VVVVGRGCKGVGGHWHEPSGSLPGGGALACLPTVVVPGPLPTQGAQAKAAPHSCGSGTCQLPGGQGAVEGERGLACAAHPNTVWCGAGCKIAQGTSNGTG